jgi:hypothetical protein
MYGTNVLFIRHIYIVYRNDHIANGRMMKTTIIILKRRQGVCIKSLLSLVMPVMLILLTGCSGGLKLTSDWQQGAMNIDGSDSEWQRGLYYDKESDMVFGVRNDDKFVYVFLKTQNRSTQMQVMRNGLTVWFDREDGKNQAFGIKYPIGRQETHAGFSLDTNEEKPQTFLEQEYPEMEIIGPKKEDIQRFSPLEAPGIRVKLGRTRETLVYELCVPLKKTSEHPFAVEPILLHRIGIEFETGAFKPEQSKGGIHAGGGHERGEGMGEGNPAEGGSPGSRRSHGSGDKGARSGSVEKTSQMELWLSVQLAKTISQ